MTTLPILSKMPNEMQSVNASSERSVWQYKKQLLTAVGNEIASDLRPYRENKQKTASIRHQRNVWEYIQHLLTPS